LLCSSAYGFIGKPLSLAPGRWCAGYGSFVTSYPSSGPNSFLSACRQQQQLFSESYTPRWQKNLPQALRCRQADRKAQPCRCRICACRTSCSCSHAHCSVCCKHTLCCCGCYPVKVAPGCSYSDFQCYSIA
jgi:hypothetical protein